jgi:hypothetical protein
MRGMKLQDAARLRMCGRGCGGERRDFAAEAATFLKRQNPHSIVEVKDLKSGEVTAVARKPG